MQHLSPCVQHAHYTGSTFGLKSHLKTCAELWEQDFCGNKQQPQALDYHLPFKDLYKEIIVRRPKKVGSSGLR